MHNLKDRAGRSDVFQQMTGRPAWMYLLAGIVLLPIALVFIVLALAVAVTVAVVVLLIALAGQLGRRIGAMFGGGGAAPEGPVNWPGHDPSGRRNVRVIGAEDRQRR